MNYKPELGQAIFGQPWQQFDCPESVINAICMIAEILYNKQNINPTDNSGNTFKNDVFEMNAYSWADDEQPFNFKYKDILVSWYKRIGRGTTINREINQDELKQMLNDCIDSLKNLERTRRLVVNCRKESYDVYIGRAEGERGKWGNPFSHINGKYVKFLVGSREEAISKYREWILTQPELLKELPTLKNKTLGCFCWPARCHGDVLVELIENMNRG